MNDPIEEVMESVGDFVSFALAMFTNWEFVASIYIPMLS